MLNFVYNGAMRNWLTVIKIISAILMVLFAGTALLIAMGKREKVLAVVYRFFGERERYDDEKASKVVQTVFIIFALLELLNLVFAKYYLVPALCIPTALIVCYLSLLYMDRRCRKRNKGGMTALISESYVKDTDDGRMEENE